MLKLTSEFDILLKHPKHNRGTGKGRNNYERKRGSAEDKRKRGGGEKIIIIIKNK